MNELRDLKRLVIELNQSNSTLDKKRILSKYPQCKEIIKWTYNPFKQYYVTSENLKKQNITSHTDMIKFTDIFEMLDSLDKRKVTGHAAIASVNYFIEQNKAYDELIYRIIDRNLKTRTDAKIINQVWPGTIPQFEVALAERYEDFKSKVNFSTDSWYASRKLDGVRVITIIEKGEVKFFSREGKEFLTLEKVKEEITKLNFNNVVLDGEMCIVDKNEKEDFAAMIKLIRRKDFTVPNPRYKLFDMIPLETFNNLGGQPRLSMRLNQLSKSIPKGNHILDVVEQRPISIEKELTDFIAEANTKSWEGLILRKDIPYEGKRSKNMLKVKQFLDAEYTIDDVEFGPIRVIVNGKEITETMLAAVKIKHKGNIVSVGSGFTIDDRRKYFKDPSLIKGKTATIQYFEETINEQGLYSLRFPVLKHLYENERNI
jgi:DNA ligase-1